MEPLHPDDDAPPRKDPLAALERTADLDSLVDESWADDDPIDEILPEPPGSGIGAVELDEVAEDDDGTELEPAITQEAPLPARVDDPVVLSWRSTAYVDGDPVPAVADPSRARTVWTRPGGQGTAKARLRIAGVVVETEVELADGRSSLRIGRDVLAGRFWIEV